MPDDMTPDDLQQQLRRYGQWLQQRSDVALTPRGSTATLERAAPRAVELDLGAEADRAALPQRRPLIMFAGVAVAVAALGLSGLGLARLDNSADPVATATAGGPDRNPGFATTGTDGTAGVLDLRDGGIGGAVGRGSPDDGHRSPVGSSDDDGSAEPVPDAAGATGSARAGDPPSSTGNGPEPVPAPGTVETPVPSGGQADPLDSGTDTTVASTPAPATTVADDPTPTSTPTIIDRETGYLFSSPTNGQTIDANLGTTFKARPVDGAARYRFTAHQNAQQVMTLTVPQPSFRLPSRLVTLGQGWALEPGVMTMTVAALDGSGRELARDTIMLRVTGGGGGPPRFPIPPSTGTG